MASSVFVWLGPAPTFPTPLDPASGGTGISSYTIGDLLYASGATALSKLSDVAVGSVLVSGGVGVAPAWSATPTVSRIALTQGTITADAQAMGSTATWNNAAVTFTHLRAAVTNTASNSASLLLNLLGGAGGATSMFSVRAADGKVVGNSSFETANTASFQWTGRAILKSPADAQVRFLNNAEDQSITVTVPTGTGNVLAVVVAQGRAAAQTAAVASVSTFTVGATDASFEVSANVLVTTSTNHNFTVTCTYTDEGNTARTLTLPFTLVAGSAIVNAVANANGAVPYMGIVQHIRAKAATAITVATTGTFTTVTYNVEGIIKKTT